MIRLKIIRGPRMFWGGSDQVVPHEVPIVAAAKPTKPTRPDRIGGLFLVVVVVVVAGGRAVWWSPILLFARFA